MAQTTISFRIDSELKASLEKLCDELGMNMTTAFTIFAKKMNRERRIPFEVSVEPDIHEVAPDEWDRAMIAESRKDNAEAVNLDDFAWELGFNPNDLRI